MPKIFIHETLAYSRTQGTYMYLIWKFGLKINWIVIGCDLEDLRPTNLHEKDVQLMVLFCWPQPNLVKSGARIMRRVNRTSAAGDEKHWICALHELNNCKNIELLDLDIDRIMNSS